MKWTVRSTHIPPFTLWPKGVCPVSAGEERKGETEGDVRPYEAKDFRKLIKGRI